MDCFADKDFIEKAGFGKNATNTLLQMHMIFKIHSITQDQIQFSTLNPDSLKKYFAEGKIIKHETLSKDEILLTEKPPALQKKVFNTPGIFGENTIFNRIK